MQTVHEGNGDTTSQTTTEIVDDLTLDLLFRNARSQNGWTNQIVPESTVHALYDLVKMGPTSMNQQPARFVFLTSATSKQRLAPLMMGTNGEKVLTAPVTVIIGYDPEIHKVLPKVFPHDPDAAAFFAEKPKLSAENAFRNSSLQGAYLILAARALGLDCGPMSGFFASKVEAEFFGGTATKINFVCSLGYGEKEKLFDRLPRLAFDDVATVL